MDKLAALMHSAAACAIPKKSLVCDKWAAHAEPHPAEVWGGPPQNS